MKNALKALGIPAIALVFGMAVLGACGSSAKAYSLVDPVTPDDKSAVVYFIGGNMKAAIWDGETPIGDFRECPPFNLVNMVWKTTPGTHYFIANASNWITMKAKLEANKRYFVQVYEVPQPLNIVTFVAMRVVENGDQFLKQKILSFSDKWRAEFAQEKRLKEVRVHLQSAQSDTSMETTLK